MDKEKRMRFLLDVRKLEKEHGLYLQHSDWLYVTDYVPDAGLDVFSAADSAEEEQDLRAAADAIESGEYIGASKEASNADRG